MTNRSMRWLVVVALLAFGAEASARGKKGGDRGDRDDGPDSERKTWVRKYDHNDDGRWRGGLFGHRDIRAFKKEHEAQYERLRNWCEDASDKPAKHDVQFPKGERESKYKCKKGKVDEPYLKAWIRAEKDAKEPPPPTRGVGGR